MELTQEYDKYTEEDFEVWRQLFKKQIDNLYDKSHIDYLRSLAMLSPVLNGKSIPKIENLNEYLSITSGWEIEIVPGLIEVDDFFEFLSRKKFCSSTWLRSIENLEYLEEPDMFHDIFGHIPLLMNEEYSEFVSGLGKVGVEHRDKPQVLKLLQRLYWFTIEFGLIENEDKIMIYGAGIISSLGEVNHVFEDEVEVCPFNLESILNQDFTISDIQDKYYIIDSFSQLYNSISELEEILSHHVGC